MKAPLKTSSRREAPPKSGIGTSAKLRTICSRASLHEPSALRFERVQLDQLIVLHALAAQCEHPALEIAQAQASR